MERVVSKRGKASVLIALGKTGKSNVWNFCLETTSNCAFFTPMFAEWFYALRGGEKSGPVSTEQLVDLFADGSLQRESTIVWKRGMQEWKAAYLIEELSEPIVQEKEEEEESIPEIPAEPTLVRVKRASFSLYLGTQLIGLGLLGRAAAKIFPPETVENISQQDVFDTILTKEFAEAASWGILVYFSSFIISLVYLHRAWTSIKDHSTVTKPWIAVALMCVPIFNLPWRFIAYWKWSEEWNTATRDMNAPVMPVTLFLIFCICMAVGSIFPPIAICAIILMWICHYHLVAAINFSANQKIKE